MRYIFKFPDIGEGLEEGKIVNWYVEKGQAVKTGDPLVKMETDKVVTDIPSPRSGVIAALYGAPGQTIKVGEPLTEIDLGDVGDEHAEHSVEEAVNEIGFGVVGTLEVAKEGAYLPASEENLPPTALQERKILATPVARAFAKDLGVEIHKVVGTGPAGRVLKKDIQAFHDRKTELIEQNGKEQTLPLHEDVTVEPLTQIRKTIAKNMMLSKHNASHMTVMDEMDVTELVRLRKAHKESLASEGIKLTYLPFIVMAVAKVLKRYPEFNAELDWDGGKMVYKHYINIGIAADTAEGLVVPVIRHADTLSVKELARKIQELAELAQKRSLKLEHLKGGSFTVTNYGALGGLYGVPVINYPQTAILGIGRIVEKPVVKNGQIVIGNVLPISVSVDHRVIDGGSVTRFVKELFAYLIDPATMLF